MTETTDVSNMTITRHPERRGVYQLRAEQLLPAAREDVFAFFSDAFQLETITPPWLNFHVITPAPLELRAGSIIDYKLRLRGLPLRWRSVIAAWEPPHRFVDEQVRGPYRMWHHEHVFEECDGGTLVKDAVDYSVPGGAVVHALLVRRDVQQIFQFRTKKLAEIAAQGRFGSTSQSCRAAP